MSAELKEKSDSLLAQYYKQYKPEQYDRQENLQHAINPIAQGGLIKNRTKYQIRLGVEYDSAALDGLYHGSKKWKNVDGAYVLNNYLHGIHPYTDGSTEPWNGPGPAPYYAEEQFYPTPLAQMRIYLYNEVPVRFQRHLLKHFYNSK